MIRILIAYATHTGTTADVATVISEELTKTGFETEVCLLDQVKDLDNYQAVVVGAPMIMGWHRQALRFLKQNCAALEKIPLAIFVTAMSVTSDGKLNSTIQMHLDEKLALKPRDPKRLSIKERYTSSISYSRPIIKIAPKSLKAIGFFGGRLDLYRLKWWEVLFVLLVVGAKPGEKRNWPDIRQWAAQLPQVLGILPMSD
jgi:menaquinone-dependent protoporphyrinogen oxidase